MNPTAPAQADFDRAMASLRAVVNAPAVGGPGAGDTIFFDGAWYRRQPASGDWLPAVRP